MKILIAADLYWPTINGVATFSRAHAQRLAERGHEVHVIAPSQRRSGVSEVEMDGLVTIHRTISTPFLPYQNFRISIAPQLEVRRLVQKLKPDIVHLQMILGISQAAMRYANKFDIPVVATVHAIPQNLMDNIRLLAPISKPINYIITELGIRFYGRADYVTLPTQSAIDIYSDFRSGDLPDVPIKAISNGVDLSKFTSKQPSKFVYDEFSIPKDVPLISYIGRVDAEKHINILVEAFALIRNAGHDAHLLIVGFGTEEDNLSNLAYKLGIHEDVTFTGKVTDQEIVELHRVGDVYVMPSPSELQCISALEAMASGRPIVTVNAGAVKELCQDGKNGFLCDKDNVEQIANGILKLLKDEKLRNDFGAASLEIAREHDINFTIDEYEEIYEDLVRVQHPINTALETL